MNLFKKKSLHHKYKHEEKIQMESTPKKSRNEINFKDFIGHTVTVYVDSGGFAGKGFTGVLLGQKDRYISLLVLPEASPSCSLGNACKADTSNILFCLFCPFNKNITLGSIAEISINSIVAFVHNNLS